MRTHPSSRRRPFVAQGRQQGAVLYVALIMLVLLALLGVIGMQVAGMQERMAAGYRATNMALQNAEGAARSAENAVENIANRKDAGANPAEASSDINQQCDDGFDPSAWVAKTKLGSKPAAAAGATASAAPAAAARPAAKPKPKPAAAPAEDPNW